MKRVVSVGIVLLAQSAAVLAIRVSNKSPFDLYGATYYFQKKADRVGEIKGIKAGQKVEYKRPAFKIKPKRMLLFSANKDDLKKELTSSAYHLIPRVPIGVGNDFFLDIDKGSFRGYNAAQWRVYLPIKKKLAGIIGTIDDQTLGQLRRHYMKRVSLPAQTATVRKGTSLAPQEIQFIKKRMPKVKAALEKLLGEKLTDNEVPTITIAGSGGGFRAMLGFLGLLEGAQETGLLDTVSHMTALSGSTWTLGPWMSSEWSLGEFKKRLLKKIATSLLDFKPNTQDTLDALMKRLAFNQPVTAVNAYGRILGHNLLSDLPGGPFGVYLHDQQKAIQDGSKPLPIYTAVSTKLPYQWVEFTPYEMGGDYFGGYIPSWAFGAPFLKGKMQSPAPPYPLSYILAICGSAFAARLSQVIKEFGKKIPIKKLKEDLLSAADELSIGKFRVSSGKVFNWTWGMRPLPRAQQKLIKLIDGGIWYNFAVEALYRRKANFIIVGDYSANKPGEMLRRVEKDLKERGFKVPPINYSEIGTKPISIFADPKDQTVPVIMYLPFTSLQGYTPFNPQSCLNSWCSTFKFQYGPDKANQLIELSRQRIKSAMPTIKEAFKKWIKTRRNR